MSIFHKITSAILIGLLTIPLGALPFPQKTEASLASCVPVPDVIPNPVAVPVENRGVVETVQKGLETGAAFVDCIVDPIAMMLAKALIQQLTLDIVNWINNGFEGEPAFLTNPENFFNNIGDIVGGQIIQDLVPFLCEPFKLDLNIMFQLDLRGPTPQDYNGCRISTVERNINNFVDDAGRQIDEIGDSELNDYFAASIDMRNNIDGMYIRGRAQASAGIQTAQGTIGMQLDWGNGFMGFQTCKKETIDAQGKKVTSSTTSIATTAQKTKPVKDGNDNVVYGTRVNEQGCTIETPGTLIQNQLGHVMGSDLRKLELAQSFDQILTALVGQLVKTAFSSVGLRGGSKSANNGRGFVVDNSLIEGLGQGTLTGRCTFNRTSITVGEQLTAKLDFVWDVKDIKSTQWVSEPLGADFNLSSETQATVSFTSPGSYQIKVTVTRNTDAITNREQKATILCPYIVVTAGNGTATVNSPLGLRSFKNATALYTSVNRLVGFEEKTETILVDDPAYGNAFGEQMEVPRTYMTVTRRVGSLKPGTEIATINGSRVTNTGSTIAALLETCGKTDAKYVHWSDTKKTYICAVSIVGLDFADQAQIEIDALTN